MENLRAKGYKLSNPEKEYKASKLYADWVHLARSKGPKQQKPIEYEGQLYQSKKKFREKMKIPESRLNAALKKGELDGKPIRHISKEAYFKASS